MSTKKRIAVVIALIVATSALSPLAIGGVAADEGDSSDLSIGISQGATYVTVTAINNSTGMTVADVNVTIESNGSYNASGVTNGIGSVSFDAPNETVNATVTAEKNGTTAMTNMTLVANEGDGPGFVPLGQRVASYAHGLQADGSGGIGPLISNFVTNQAGGGPPAHAGPPDDAGPSSDEDGDECSTGGPPADAGPPDDAGPNSDEDADGDDESDCADGGGPPEDAGGPPEDGGGPPEDAGPPS